MGWAILLFIILAAQYYLANWYTECSLPADWVICSTLSPTSFSSSATSATSATHRVHRLHAYLIRSGGRVECGILLVIILPPFIHVDTTDFYLPTSNPSTLSS